MATRKKSTRKSADRPAGGTTSLQGTFEDLCVAKCYEANNLLDGANVSGLGIGYRTRRGETTDELTLKVYVTRKVAQEYVHKDDLLPSTVSVGKRRLGVDIEQAPMHEAQVFNLRSRPLRGGSSIGTLTAAGQATGTGTLGVCVTRDDGRTYMLSNDHVLTVAGLLPIGSRVTQPSLPDGGASPGDQIATVVERVPIDFGTTVITLPGGRRVRVRNPNEVDAALAVVDQQFENSNREIHWVGYPAFDVLDLRNDVSAIGRLVHKMGRTTEYTVGEIISVANDVPVDYSRAFGNQPGTNVALFIDQLRIRRVGGGDFSRPGDSGSLIVDAATNRPVGLLFAGGGGSTSANHIRPVMQALNIPRI